MFQKVLFDLKKVCFHLQAGINPDRLILSLEPEAASILCQYLPITKSEMGFTVSKIGTEYMVVDLGGK